MRSISSTAAATATGVGEKGVFVGGNGGIFSRDGGRGRGSAATPPTKASGAGEGGECGGGGGVGRWCELGETPPHGVWASDSARVFSLLLSCLDD